MLAWNLPVLRNYSLGDIATTTENNAKTHMIGEIIVLTSFSESSKLVVPLQCKQEATNLNIIAISMIMNRIYPFEKHANKIKRRQIGFNTE